MPLPKYNEPAGWSAFLKNPEWADIGDKELTVAFRRFFFSGRRIAATIIMNELAVRIAAYANASTSAELAEDLRQDCFVAICSPRSIFGLHLSQDLEHFVRSRARSVRRRRGQLAARFPALTEQDEKWPDTSLPNADDRIFLRELLEEITDPKERAAYELLLLEHKVSGEDSIASKMKIARHTARDLIARAKAQVIEKAGLETDPDDRAVPPKPEDDE